MSLPSGYRKLEDIQSSGTQYIDTGIIGSYDTRVTADFEVLSIGSGTVFVFGSQANNDVRFCLGITSASVFRSDYGTEYISGPSAATGTKYKADKNRNVCTINGTAINSNVQTFTGTTNIYLFARNYSSLSYASLKMYGCKIYSNDVLVRDFIPCKNPSGVVGMWDDVNDTFYSNAGSGTFTAGPEVKGTNKTLIDGTAYGVETGKCLISGTAYALKKGRTLIGGTGYDVKLTKNSYLITFIYEKDVSADARSTATLYYGTQEIQSGQTFEIQKGETLIFQNSSPYAWAYVYLYVDGEYQGSFEASNSYTPAKYEFMPTADCEIKAVLGRNESDAKWYVTTS